MTDSTGSRTTLTILRPHLASVCIIAVTVQEEADDDSDLSDYGDEVDGRKDALAEPCFMLIGEIFELRGSEYYIFLICSQLHFFFFKYNLKIKKGAT